MKQNPRSNLNKVLKLTSFAVVLFMLSGIITGCRGKKEEPMAPAETATVADSSDATKTSADAAPEGMYLYDGSEFEVYYPKEWEEKIDLSEFSRKVLYKDDMNSIEFVFEDMEYGSIEEAVKNYKQAAVISFEETKTRKGDTVYLAENSIGKGVYFTAYLFGNNRQYELRASMTYDFYNKNIESVRRIAKEIHIITNADESTASSGSSGTEGDGNNSEINQKLQKLEQDNLNSKKYMKVGEIEDMVMEAGGGDATFDHATLYSATWAVLTGLTQGHKGLLETCVYDPQNEIYKLTSQVSEFANDDIAPHLRDFKVYIAGKDKVYIDLNEQGVDMQFYIQYNKIAGKYYFKDFIQE